MGRAWSWLAATLVALLQQAGCTADPGTCGDEVIDVVDAEITAEVVERARIGCYDFDSTLPCDELSEPVDVSVVECEAFCLALSGVSFGSGYSVRIDECSFDIDGYEEPGGGTGGTEGEDVVGTVSCTGCSATERG